MVCSAPEEGFITVVGACTHCDDASAYVSATQLLVSDDIGAYVQLKPAPSIARKYQRAEKVTKLDVYVEV